MGIPNDPKEYKKGQWNLICDRSGRKIKSGDAVKEWNGLVVHKDEYEPRQPQDFVKAKADNQTVPYSRAESSSNFLSTNEVTASDL